MRKTTFVAILILGAIGKQKEKSKGENTQMKANPKTLDTVERERERERESYLNEIKCGIVRQSYTHYVYQISKRFLENGILII